MSFFSIPPATKSAAVKHYWKTGNLRGTANKFGVSRNAIYEWLRSAESNWKQPFRASFPGKKPATLAEQNATLRAQLDDVLDIYHNISQPPLSAISLAR